MSLQSGGPDVPAVPSPATSTTNPSQPAAPNSNAAAPRFPVPPAPSSPALPARGISGTPPSGPSRRRWKTFRTASQLGGGSAPCEAAARSRTATVRTPRQRLFPAMARDRRQPPQGRDRGAPRAAAGEAPPAAPPGPSPGPARPRPWRGPTPRAAAEGAAQCPCRGWGREKTLPHYHVHPRCGEYGLRRRKRKAKEALA